MKIANLNVVAIILLTLLSAVSSTSCSNDDDGPSASVTVNEGPSGDIGGDFTGNGGSTSRAIVWSNNRATADYNADITASQSGTFQMVVEDADGTVVLDRILTGALEPDSIDGVTTAGTPGNWTVTIILTDFDGDGSYSLSAGN